MLPLSTFFVYVQLLKEWIWTIENWIDVIMIFISLISKYLYEYLYDAWTNISLNIKLPWKCIMFYTIWKNVFESTYTVIRLKYTIIHISVQF